MKLTNSLKLKKPDGSDFYDVENFNYNADVIDEELEKVNSAIGQMANDRGYVNSKLVLLGSANDIVLNGKYLVNYAVLNLPTTDENYYIEVTSQDSNTIKQTATGYSTGRIFERIKYNTWGEWKRVITPELISNPNLLINETFQIWQRGTSFLNITQYATYTADRWRIDVDNGSKASVEKVVNGVKFTVNLNGSFNPLYVQELEINSYIQGKKLTFSTEFKDINGNFHIRLQYLKNGVYTPIVSELIQSNKKISVTADIPNDIERLWAIIGSIPSTANGSFFIIKSAKLELGEIATPLSPRPYGEELALCQRYYTKINYNYKETIGTVNVSNTWLNLMISTDTELRVSTPTVTITCSPTRSDNNAAFPPFTNISARGGTANLGFTYTGTPTNCYSYANQQGYISLDAEIY